MKDRIKNIVNLKPETKSKISTIFKWLWTLAIIIFIGLYLYRNFDKIVKVISEIKLIYSLLTLLVLFLVKLFLTYNLKLSLCFVDRDLSFGKTYKIYNVSQLGKYIPGNFWHFVGKISYLKGEGLDNKSVRSVVLLELIFLICGSLLFGGVFLIFNPVFIDNIIELLRNHGLIVSVIAGILIILFVLLVIFKRSYITDTVKLLSGRWKLLLKVAVVQFLIWILQGLSFYFIINQFIDYSLIFYVIGLYSLAFIIGFVFPLAPAGIGVREFIIVMGLLSVGVGEDISVSLVGLHRILYVIIEVFMVLLGFAVEKSTKIISKKD